MVNHLAAHPAERFSIAELAQLANFSDFHFHRLFKAYTGETPAELARRLRLEQAAEDLVYQREPNITALAMSLGFSSSANFTKAFSGHFGVAPSRYAASHRRTPPSQSSKFSKPGKAPTTLTGDTSDHALAERSKQSLENPSLEITIEEQPLTTLAYLRHVGPYEPQVISGLFEQLMQFVQRQPPLHSHHKVDDAQTLGITWSDSSVAEPQSWRYDAAVVVDHETQASDGVDLQILAPGKIAVLKLQLTPPDYSPIALAWDYLLGEWLPESHWQPAHRPSFERYHQGSNTGTTSLALCLPIEPNR